MQYLDVVWRCISCCRLVGTSRFWVLNWTHPSPHSLGVSVSSHMGMWDHKGMRIMRGHRSCSWFCNWGKSTSSFRPFEDVYVCIVLFSEVVYGCVQFNLALPKKSPFLKSTGESGVMRMWSVPFGEARWSAGSALARVGQLSIPDHCRPRDMKRF